MPELPERPERICIWDEEEAWDGEVLPRGWTTSYQPGDPDEYVRLATLRTKIETIAACLESGVTGTTETVADLRALVSASSQRP